MSTTSGFYSLIQYCPDHSRMEAANVGVILFSPAREFIQARVSHNNDRIRRFFSPEGADWAQINSLKDSLVRRLEVEAADFRSLEDLERYAALQANELRITPPRPLKVLDPEKDLAKLFEQLVGGRARRMPGEESEDVAPVDRLIRREFAREDLSGFLRRNLRVNVPTLRREIVIPYGFKNGSWNLIQTARFEQISVQGVTRAACEIAVTGRSLAKHPDPDLGEIRLIVVGAFRGSAVDSQGVVRDILSENDVQLYPLAELKNLVTKIRETAHPLNADGQVQ